MLKLQFLRNLCHSSRPDRAVGALGFRACLAVLAETKHAVSAIPVWAETEDPSGQRTYTKEGQMGTGETIVYRDEREDSLARVAFDRLWLAKPSDTYPNRALSWSSKQSASPAWRSVVVGTHGSNANEAQTSVNCRT